MPDKPTQPERRESTRRLASITPDDEVAPREPRDGEGPPRVGGHRKLWAYGAAWIARLARVERAAVWRAIRGGDFDPADPLATVQWMLRRRGAADLAHKIGSALSSSEPPVQAKTAAATFVRPSIADRELAHAEES